MPNTHCSMSYFLYGCRPCVGPPVDNLLAVPSRKESLPTLSLYPCCPYLCYSTHFLLGSNDYYPFFRGFRPCPHNKPLRCSMPLMYTCYDCPKKPGFSSSIGNALFLITSTFLSFILYNTCSIKTRNI
jgi:hypothetical protein